MFKHIPSLTLCILLMLTASYTFGQLKDYKVMMADNSYNFYEVVAAAEKHFEVYGTGKGSGHKGYQRWKNENESKYYPSGKRSNVDHYAPFTAYQELLSSIPEVRGKGQFDTGWEELGPWDANTITRHYSPGIGRVETFWINPNNSDHMFLGSRSGGFWKTIDGGANWENTTDFLVASGVRSIAVNPFNIDEVLISVQQGGNGYSHGVYRSLDGGSTWNITNINPSILNWGGLGDNEQIFKIAYHPYLKDQIFVASTRGLFLSNDNLETWKTVIGSWVLDIEFHPTDTSTIYAYRYTTSDVDNIKISTDGGSTFTNSAQINGNDEAKGHISVSPAQPDFVYFASKNGLWKSTNQGATFTFLSNPDEDCEGFAVSDLDTNNIIYGYVDTEASTDGGYTFSQKTRWSKRDSAYVHADIRTAECVNGVFYLGTDGYLAKSEDNGTTWTRLNDGSSIREFYAVGLSQSNNKVQMAGSQDNGTSILSENGWVEWNGGDGMEALVHPLNDQWMLGSWQYGSRQKTTNGGQGRFDSKNPRRGQGKANWEAPFLLNPLDHMVVYHFADTIYRGTDFGSKWEVYSIPDINGEIVDAAIAENDSNIMVISRYSIIRLTTDGGKNWTDISNGLPGYYITDLAFDPKDDSTILLTYNRYNNDGRKVFQSKDLGQTWENITYNLTNMPLRTIVMDASDSSYIYVGGEIGVYYKSKGSTKWTLYSENLPNVTVKDLEIHYGSNTLRAATWGRGLWENSLVNKHNFPAITNINITNTPNSNSPKESVGQYVSATVNYLGNVQDVIVYWSINNISLSNGISMQKVNDNKWEATEPITGLNQDDIYFKVVAKSESREGSSSYRFHYKVNPFQYCEAEGSESTSADYINYVALNGMEHASGQDFYGNFIDSTILLTREGEYTLHINMNFHWELDTTAGWIDFNGDAEFSDGELIVMSLLDEEHKSSGTFTVPADAKINTPLRMRVRSQYWNQSPISCGTIYGEVEDYTVVIERQPVSVENRINNKSFSITPNPNQGEFQVTLSEKTEVLTVSILNVQGIKLVEISRQNTNQITINEALKAGIYIVEVTTKNGISTKKIVVE